MYFVPEPDLNEPVYVCEREGCERYTPLGGWRYCSDECEDACWDPIPVTTSGPNSTQRRLDLSRRKERYRK